MSDIAQLNEFYDDLEPFPCLGTTDEAPCGKHNVRPGKVQCAFTNGFGCHEEPVESVREQSDDSIKEIHSDTYFPWPK